MAARVAGHTRISPVSDLYERDHSADERRHYEDLFRLLKVSYLEEETRERYLRALYSADRKALDFFPATMTGKIILRSCGLLLHASTELTPC